MSGKTCGRVAMGYICSRRVTSAERLPFVESVTVDCFNLIDEPWIPVLYDDSRCVRVGIQKALEDAGSIRQIAATNPMDRVAVLRFLLGVLYWCQDNPTDQKRVLITKAQFPENWFCKLREQREIFNLLGNGKRFYQDSAATRQRAATDLIQEIPTGNNFWHFRHSTDSASGLCIPCCVMGLLRLPLFSVSGLPDLKAGINGTPPIYAIPIAKSLMATLLLNWVAQDSVGSPAWEGVVSEPGNGKSVPILAGMTLLSRRVKLHDPVSCNDACVSCGDVPGRLIKTCYYQSAGKCQNTGWTDPHVMYTQVARKDRPITRASMKAPDMTKAPFKYGRPWADLLGTLITDHPESVSLFIVGFATDQAKNIDVWEFTCAMAPRRAEGGPDAAQRVTQWHAECERIHTLVAHRLGVGNPKRCSRSKAAAHAIRPDIEARVFRQVTELAGGGDAIWQDASEKYRPMMASLAASLSPGFTTQALIRRDEIAGTLPNMRRKRAPAPPKHAATGDGK